MKLKPEAKTQKPEAAEMDDFSFPTIAGEQDSSSSSSSSQHPFPHFATSPVWFMSSVSEEKTTLRRKSFETANLKKDLQSLEDELNSPALSDDDEEGNERSLENEEKMDLLWEDFNEELARISSHKRSDVAAAGKLLKKGSLSSLKSSLDQNTPTIGSEFDQRRHDSMIELCRIHVMEMTKSSSVIRRKRTSLLVMLKLLKKLFLIQKTHSSRRT